MQLGEVVFGGVGSGLYGMLVFAILAVFIAGLMIGRTPEYLGKKIEAYEMKMSSIAILVTPLLVLVGTAIAVMSDAGRATHRQPGRARLLRNPVRLHVGRQQQRQRLRRPRREHAVLQHDARHRDVVRPLRRDRAGAGDRRLAGREEAHWPSPAGTMPTHGALFVVLLVGTVLLVGLLNYVPALALGPVIEHLDALEVSADNMTRKTLHAVRSRRWSGRRWSMRSRSWTRACSGATR